MRSSGFLSRESNRTKKIIKSFAGVVPLAGKLILMRPEKPAPLIDAMSKSVSVVVNAQAESSIVRVNCPVVALRLVIVKGIAVGVGV